MNHKKLEEFLRGYAETLREGVPWSEFGRCNPRVKMASGAVVVEEDGKPIAEFFCTDGNYDPSMPVSPKQIQLSKLLSETVNFLRHLEEQDG